MIFLYFFIHFLSLVELKIRSLEDQHRKEKDETEILMRKQQEDYERKIKELEEKSQQVINK